MKRLTKEQELKRDAETDWRLAQLCCHAQYQSVWHDYSPTSDWREAGPLIEKYQIDIRYFDKNLSPDVGDEWMGGLNIVSKETNMLTYCTAYGPTPLVAAMRALAKALNK